MGSTKSRSNEAGCAVELSRRAFLKRSTLGVAAAGVGARIGMGLGSTLWQTGARPLAPAFPRGAVIRTLLKDVPPAELSPGAVLFHEHLSLHYPLTNAIAARQGAPTPTHFSDDVYLMIAETRAAGADGVSCIVDGGHPDMDRSLDALKRIAAGSPVHIVASGGYYMQRNYPPEITAKSADPSP